jgi:hypothetical protein
MGPALQFFFALIPAIPMLSVALIGIIFGVRRRGNQPIASRFIILGLSALAVNVVGSVAVHVYAHQSFQRYEDATVLARHLVELNVVLYALNLAGVALITAAVFANRAPGHLARLTIGSSDRGAASSLDQGGSR